jgi:hypothetical protein
MSDLEKKIDKVLHATTRRQRIPSLYEIKGKFYHAKSGKPVKTAPVKPMLVRPSGVSRDMWTWVEKGGRAWDGEDPRGKERTPTRRYNEWVARGGLKRAARAKQAMGGKRRKAKRREMSHDEKMMVLAKKLSTPRKTCPRCAFFYDADLTTCPQCGGRRTKGAAAMGGKRRHSDPDVVDVMFRVVKSGEDKGIVEAFFPGLPGTNWWDMTAYAHVGQHSDASFDYVSRKTRPAKPSEYAALKRELESKPYEYKLRVVKKATQRHLAQRQAAMKR